MKLYYSKGACSLAVRIVIHELGLPSEYESVNLKTKVTESGANFLEINPKGAVPTLVTDNKTVMTENAVIQQYLAETNKNHTLLPPVGDPKRYKVLEWLNFISTDIHNGFGAFFNPAISDELKASLFLPMLKRKFAIANQALANQNFLMGDTFTLPDSYLFVMILWTFGMKIDIQEFPNLIRYFEALKKRPSVAASLAEEGLAN